MKHIFPEDSHSHIEDLGCSCNPSISIVEGEEMVYHNKIEYPGINNTQFTVWFEEDWFKPKATLK